MEIIRSWWATISSNAKAALIGAVAAFILSLLIPRTVQMWLDHLAEKAIRRIDDGLTSGPVIRTMIYERDIARYLGIWKPLRFMVMRKIEKRGWVVRQLHVDSERGVVWQRRMS